MPQGGVGDNLKFRHSANEPSSRGLAVPVCDLVFCFFKFWGNGGVPDVVFRCCLVLGPLFWVWDVACSCSESVLLEWPKTLVVGFL